jgi:hypothetical protein
MKIKKTREAILIIVAILFVTMKAYANDDAAAYLIMNDIPPFYRLTETIDAYTHKRKTIPGYTSNRLSGALQGVDQYLVDLPITYETTYQSDTLEIGIGVQVTKFVSSDSDKWLVHELDMAFRDKFDNALYVPRLINGQTLFVMAIVDGRSYRWLSGKTVIAIEYRGSPRTLPEPMEIVHAYLLKHPSTLPPLTLQELRSAANKST